MSQVDFDHLLDMLNDYAEGDLDDFGKSYLKDEILDLSEQLHEEETFEGMAYEGMMVLVKQGEPIPQPYEDYSFHSLLTGEAYMAKVKEITGIQLNSEGNLVINILAKKVKEKKS